VIAWGDFPTWLLVIATAIGGFALLWQLRLQRQQLREQQRVLAQRVILEREDLYPQMVQALNEWDTALLPVLDRRRSGERAEPDTTTELTRKLRAVRDILAKVELLGSLRVVEQARRAVSERYALWSRLAAEEADIADLDVGFQQLRETVSSLLETMREELLESRPD
jgi:hypothetical protein